MRALLQRVASASVTVDGQCIGSIEKGLLIFAAVHKSDTPEDGEVLIRKILSVRLFEDENGKMNRTVADAGGGLLVVSQFTLYGDLSKGTRPSFSESMPGPQAKEFYEKWVAKLRQACALKIEEGRFAAHMEVRLLNDGPVTLLIDSRKDFYNA